MTSSFHVFVCISLVAAACNGAASTPSSAPLEIQWTMSSGEPQFKLGSGAGVVSATATGLRIKPYELAKATLEIGARKVVIGDDNAPIEIANLTALGAVAFADLAKVDTGLAVTLTLPDGKRATSKIPPVSYDRVIKDALARVAQGPLVFANEPADSRPSDALFDIGDGDGALVGRSGTLQELDFIATRKTLDATSKLDCQYKHMTMEDTFTTTVRFRPVEVVIHSRRTGEVVERKVFTPKRVCPFVSEGYRTDDSLPSSQDISKWLATWLETAGTPKNETSSRRARRPSR